MTESTRVTVQTVVPGSDRFPVSALELLVLILFATLTVAIVVPQAYRLWSTRNASGLSLAGLLNGIVGYAAWTVYLSVQGDWVPMAATAVAGVIWVGTAAYASVRLGLTRAAVASALGYAATLGALSLVDTAVFGIALSLGAVWSGLPSVAAAWRAERIAGISVGTWVLYVAESLSWLAWALLERDLVVGLYGALATVIGVAVLAAVMVRVEARIHHGENRHDRGGAAAARVVHQSDLTNSMH